MTQKNKIKQHLKKIGSITPLDALDLYDCFRLGARIWDLKEEGMNIITKINSGSKKYAIYSLR
ncbi:hypothetical protein LCGC14_0364510 [marine sediment metagenome]|uniref:Winged helix-turn-helix domain-containing protein n=1 Tax=marine sediment metagenome TaxID=412755 RepID=A0A0F9TCQ3_9ZZZZ